MFCMLVPSSYCSTIAGTRPHFPAVNTCPPSTAMASASLRCRMGKTTNREAQGRLGKIQSRSFMSLLHPAFYHDHLQAIVHCGGSLTLNDTASFLHAVDAPCVALGCLGAAHCAPFDGAGWSGRGHCCRGWHTTKTEHQHESKGLWGFLGDLWEVTQTIPIWRARMVLMYSAPRYR